jgi:hypothetical protein
MEMSGGRPNLQRGSVTEHRPHHVGPVARQRDERLGVPAPF